VFAIKAMYEKVLPPTLNLHERTAEFDLDYVPLEAKAKSSVRAVLSNSFGFGGTNASLCFANID
jgi:3-oxoacyl-[acyl-carrier-protein] synthase II